MSRGIGSDDAQPFLTDDVDRLLLDLLSVFIHLCKSAGKEDDLSDPPCRTIPKRLRSLLGRKYDNRQVYSLGKISDRRLNGQAQDFSPLWVDQIDFSRILIG